MPSPDKLSLIIQSDNYDRVHYALAMASTALATGKAVTLFFTMQGTRALIRGFSDHAQENLYAERGIATFEEMLAACEELGAKIMVCETGLLAMNICRPKLRQDSTITEGSAASFLSDASATGSMLYV